MNFDQIADESRREKIRKTCKEKGIGKWMRGRKFSYETRLKMSQAKKGIRPKNNYLWFGANHPKWKGDDVGEVSLHNWVKRQLGKPNKCKFCGVTTAKRFDWANKSGNYLRDIKDWLRLCSKCHWHYDHEREMGNLKRRFGYG